MKFVFLFSFILTCFSLHSQDYLYLNNGRVIPVYSKARLQKDSLSFKVNNEVNEFESFHKNDVKYVLTKDRRFMGKLQSKGDFLLRFYVLNEINNNDNNQFKNNSDSKKKDEFDEEKTEKNTTNNEEISQLLDVEKSRFGVSFFFGNSISLTNNKSTSFPFQHQYYSLPRYNINLEGFVMFDHSLVLGLNYEFVQSKQIMTYQQSASMFIVTNREAFIADNHALYLFMSPRLKYNKVIIYPKIGVGLNVNNVKQTKFDIDKSQSIIFTHNNPSSNPTLKLGLKFVWNFMRNLQMGANVEYTYSNTNYLLDYQLNDNAQRYSFDINNHFLHSGICFNYLF